MRVQRFDSFDGVVKIESTDDGYALSFDDGRENVWVEEFPTRALAFLRLAALVQCEGSNWTQSFSVAPEEFCDLGEKFFSEVVTH